MADNLKKKKSDGKLISLTEKWEVEYWTTELMTSKEVLEDAIKRVGHSAEDVRYYLIVNDL